MYFELTMDILWIIISCLMVIGLPKEAEAGCAQDLQSNQQFQTCVMGYSMFIANEAQTLDPNNPNAMVDLLCSTEGKQKVKCLIDYTETCPDLITTGSYATMLQSLQILKQMGGYEVMCNIISGPCTGVQQCVSSQDLKLKEGIETPTNPPTPFSLFPPYSGYICGPLREIFKCFENADKQCSSIEAGVRNMLEMAGQQLPSDSAWPTYDETKMFALQECPTLPSDFATNKCVMDNLKSDDFVTCFQDVSENNPMQNNTITCDAYKAGHNCVSMYIGAKCGRQYTRAMEKITPLFMAGIPKTCKLESSEPNGSILINMFSLQLLVAFILALKLM